MFKKYKYSTNPDIVPFEQADPPEGWDYEDFVKAAGFSPADEEIATVVLSEEWNGHPAGSYGVTDLTIEGYPFAIYVP